MMFSDRIFVTGATGFVGKRLIEKLNEKGFNNIVTPKYKLDLTNQNQVKGFFKENQIDHVIHLAAVVGGIKANVENPFKFLMNNLQIQNNVIESAIETKVKKFLFMSSSCAYPCNYKSQPLKEEYLLDGKPEETNEGYALAKIVGSKLCEYANRKFGTNFITLASSNVYGPGDHFNLDSSHALAALILKTYNAFNSGNPEVEVWGSGKACREWLHVDDLCDGIIWSMLCLNHTNTFLNIGTGKDISMNDLARKIFNVFYGMGFKNTSFGELKIKNDISKPDGMLVKRLDVSKINCLGWEAKIDLDSGIDNTVRGFLREHI